MYIIRYQTHKYVNYEYELGEACIKLCIWMYIETMCHRRVDVNPPFYLEMCTLIYDSNLKSHQNYPLYPIITSILLRGCFVDDDI